MISGPIRYYGGKGILRKWIINYFPDHDYYVEPFGGGGWMLFAKEKCDIEVYNDIDETLYDFFTVLANPNDFEVFKRRIEGLPCSRQLYDEYKVNYKECGDKVERVIRWFYVMRNSFSGSFGSGWKHSVASDSRNLSRTVGDWLNVIDNLSEIHNRLKKVQIECQDFRNILKTYDGPSYLCYADPPYLPDTRKDIKKYNYEMSYEDHVDLIELLLNYEGMVVLSGYKNELYSILEKEGWERKDKKTVSHSTLKTKKVGVSGKGSGTKKYSRIESLWLNPQTIKALNKGQHRLL